MRSFVNFEKESHIESVHLYGFCLPMLINISFIDPKSLGTHKSSCSNCGIDFKNEGSCCKFSLIIEH